MTERNERRGDGQWVSILGVPPERVRPHFWTFSVCFAITLAFYIYVHVFEATEPSWRLAPTLIIGDTTRAAAFWVLASPIMVEGVVMVFAALYRQRKREEGRVEGRQEGRAEGRQEGRQEGRAEADAQWDAWNLRRMEAEANGDTFTEPPPSARNGSAGG